MKQIKIIYVLFSLLLFSCSEKGWDDHSKAADEEEVEMGVATQRDFLPLSGAVNYENDIYQLDLLVFNHSNQFLYRKEAWLSGLVYKANLKIQDDIHIYFAANMRTFLQQAELDFLIPDASWQEIHTKLTDEDPSRLIGGTTYLPMWGKLQNASVKEGIINKLNVYNANKPIPLIRSVAAVDAIIQEDPAVFQLSEAILYFSPDKGILTIDNDNYNSSGEEVNTPAAPSGMKTVKTFTAGNVEENSIKQQLYIYDNPSNSVTTDRRYTRLVLGGKYKSPTKVTYYPLDFHDGTNLYKITRNCKYIMSITSVNGDGYNTAEEASKAAPVNMDFGVIQWSMREDENIVVDGPNFLSVEKKEVILYYTPLRPLRIHLTTSYQPTDLLLELAGGTSVALNTIPGYEDELGIQNEQFRIRLICSVQDEVTHLEFTALNCWDSGFDEDLLTITAGRIKFEVGIRQMDYDPNDWLEGEQTIVE